MKRIGIAGAALAEKQSKGIGHMNKEICAEYGIDFETGVARFRGNDTIFAKLLAMFLEDDTFDRMKDAYDKKDCGALFRLAHEMKGASGNAALVDLYDADCVLLEYLRAGGTDGDTIDGLFSDVQKQHDRAMEGARLALATE